MECRLSLGGIQMTGKNDFGSIMQMTEKADFYIIVLNKDFIKIIVILQMTVLSCLLLVHFVYTSC